MRFQFIHECREQFSIRTMCRAFGVSRSGYFAWCSRSESVRSREDRRLRIKLREIHNRSRKIYGSPRVFHELRKDESETCGLNRTARLMREEGLRGKKKGRYTSTTDSRHKRPIASNVLNRAFDVSTPNTVWGGDMTYLRTREGWFYLAVLLDLCTRSVVCWSLSSDITEGLALGALEDAVSRHRPPPGLLHHTDRGGQYAGRAYIARLRQLKMEQSMSRKGNCWDNAPLESFFDSLKTEIGIKEFSSKAEARAEVFDYIECFYNPTRLHSSLDYQSPRDFERSLAE